LLKPSRRARSLPVFSEAERVAAGVARNVKGGAGRGSHSAQMN
jgi:hypothetical protein